MDNATAPAGGQPSEPEFIKSDFPKFSDIDINNATPEQVDALVKANQKLFGLTEHYSDKAKKLSEKPKETTPAPTTTPQPPAPGAVDDDIRTSVKRLEMVEEKRQFGHSNSLTPEETDNLFAFATGMNLKPAEAMNHPFFKSGLEALRQEAKANGATPGPSRRAPVVEGKTFDQMTTDEKRKNFDKIVKAGKK